LQYKSAVVTPAASPWTQSAVNGLVARVGYSTDSNPNPYWDAIVLEASVTDVQGYNGSHATAQHAPPSGSSRAGWLPAPAVNAGSLSLASPLDFFNLAASCCTVDRRGRY